MATIRVFEELEIWRLARVQCQELFNLIQAGCLDTDTPLRDQMNRSSGSVMDNIAEGFDRFSKADFRNFLVIARGSNAEFRSQCYRCKDRGFINSMKAESLIEDGRHLGIKINGLIKHLDQSDYKTKPKSLPPDTIEEPATEYEPLEAAGYDLPSSFILTP